MFFKNSVFSEIKSDIVNGCSTNYTLTRTWTTSDCGKNTVTFTQIITVRDTTSPTGAISFSVSSFTFNLNITGVS